jgi:hypothetical protein
LCFEGWKLLFFEGWPTRFPKNGTKNIFNNMVQSYRVFMYQRKGYNEKINLEKYVTRLFNKFASYFYNFLTFVLFFVDHKPGNPFFQICFLSIKFHHIIRNIICPIFGRSSWSPFLKKIIYLGNTFTSNFWTFFLHCHLLVPYTKNLWNDLLYHF